MVAEYVSHGNLLDVEERVQAVVVAVAVAVGEHEEVVHV